MPDCQDCGRALREGESAYATQWKVIAPGGWALQTRYLCESCAEEDA